MNREIKLWYESYSTKWGHVKWEVSNYGEVFKNGELFECKIRGGYKIITHGTRLHKVVAQLFLQKPETDKRLVIDHIDGNRLNNRVDNLRYCTQKENIHNNNTWTNFIGYLKSDQHKINCSKPTEARLNGYKKMSNSKTGCKKMTNDIDKPKMVRPEEQQIYLDKGWRYTGYKKIA